jgi:hypothetical protein
MRAGHLPPWGFVVYGLILQIHDKQLSGQHKQSQLQWNH